MVMAMPLAINVSDLLKPGVYLLGLRGRVTYIGKARCILVALATQTLRNRNRELPSWFPVKVIPFDSIEIIPCDTTRATELAVALIAMHAPIHNRERHTPAPIPNPTLPPTSHSSNHVRRL